MLSLRPGQRLDGEQTLRNPMLGRAGRKAPLVAKDDAHNSTASQAELLSITFLRQWPRGQRGFVCTCRAFGVSFP